MIEPIYDNKMQGFWKQCAITCILSQKADTVYNLALQSFEVKFSQLIEHGFNLKLQSAQQKNFTCVSTCRRDFKNLSFFN